MELCHLPLPFQHRFFRYHFFSDDKEDTTGYVLMRFFPCEEMYFPPRSSRPGLFRVVGSHIPDTSHSYPFSWWYVSLYSPPLSSPWAMHRKIWGWRFAHPHREYNSSYDICLFLQVSLLTSASRGEWLFAGLLCNTYVLHFIIDIEYKRITYVFYVVIALVICGSEGNYR